ncbi:hypothetical protein AX15_006414 [Amanita polypyramis BW_CC]|nr:hypothetical protein AX15_006414 [Amanita polypyramis BW_CC]
MDAGDIKAVTCIPFNEDEPNNAEDHYWRLLTQDYETLDEVRLRLNAYHRAWQKCLRRLQSSIRSQHEPIIRDVIHHIRSSYLENPIKTPYDELPVVCIQSSLSGSSILDEVCVSLDEDEDKSAPRVIQVHLYPSDCPSVMMGMKNIIMNLVEQGDVAEVVKRKPSTSVATFDIELLVAWYTALCNTSRNAPDPLIVIVMHDFEQFDPSIMQDIFYIFSQQVTRLHSVFILSLSSPLSPSFLHLAYPKSTLSLLCADTFVAPSGLHVLQKAFQQTFFDIKFDPDILLGPTVLEQIFYHIKRNSISQDVFLTSIQLVHLRHFMTNPLSLLVHETPVSCSSDNSLRDIITNRLHLISQLNGRQSPAKKRPHQKEKTASWLVSAVDRARETFTSHSLQMRLGFGLVMLVYEILERQGEVGEKKTPRFTLTDMMLDALRGDVHKYVQRLGQFVRYFDESQLTGLLDQLHEFFEQPPLAAKEEIADFLSFAMDKVKRPEQVARDVCEWLEEYLESLTIKRFDDFPLWDVWYTGDAPFPSEFLNPSTRASVLSGLLRPHEYAQLPNLVPTSTRDTQPTNGNDASIPELWQLPDISILFGRYTESGKIINVYDWFESFQVALESQRKHLKKQRRVAEEMGTSGGSISPKKGKGKEKVSVEQLDEDLDDSDDEDDDEQWKLQVQVRFIRALHELDYLGFIKHTGRKADHVLRTVFDVGD